MMDDFLELAIGAAWFVGCILAPACLLLWAILSAVEAMR